MVSSRYQLVAAPAYEPGEDVITRSTIGPFVDAGAWIQPSPRRKRIYLSVDTIRELAEVAGISRPESLSELQLAAARAEGALAVLKENLGGDLVHTLVRLGHLLSGAGGVDGDDNAEDDPELVRSVNQTG